MRRHLPSLLSLFLAGSLRARESVAWSPAPDPFGIRDPDTARWLSGLAIDPFGLDPVGGEPLGADPFGGPPVAPAPAVHQFTRTPNLTPFNPLFPNLELQPRAFDVNTPGGTVRIEILPAASISALAPREPDDPRGIFRPPAFFSAPLPTGSGARALGFSGTFTAIADDATASSWNPSGLINLETPEASVVHRFSRTRNRHHSADPDFQPDSSRYDSDGVNYFSVVVPFFPESLGRNLVVSLNHQEAYDFEHEFAARVADRTVKSIRGRRTGVASGVQEDRFTFENGRFDVSVLTTVTTRSESVLEQATRTELDARLRFLQTGVIEASTPAFALELSPKLSVGGALNFYQDSPLPGRGILARTSVDYTIRQQTRARVTNRQDTTASYVTSAVEHVPGLPPFFPPFDVELEKERGEFPAFRDEQVINQSSSRVIGGTYTQTDRTADLEGINATLGLLYTLNRFFVLGASVDLPWTADARQTRVIRNVLREHGGAERKTETIEARDVSFDFPLFWSAGVVFRLSDRFYTSLDAGFTRWSTFSFEGGEGRVNPLDGTPHGQNPVGDTLSWRAGLEYLLLLKKTEIPLRLGVIHEERPALSTPDTYQGFSLGTGVSLGRDPGKVILDVAYSLLSADDVQTVIPGRDGLRSDTRQQQVFISLIWHFP